MSARDLPRQKYHGGGGCPDPEVYPDDAKAAGEAAGHPWQNVRRAAGLTTRITSVPAHGEARTERVWKITPSTTTQEDAS